MKMMKTMNINIGVLTETKVSEGMYTKTPHGYTITATERSKKQSPRTSSFILSNQQQPVHHRRNKVLSSKRNKNIFSVQHQTMDHNRLLYSTQQNRFVHIRPHTICNPLRSQQGNYISRRPQRQPTKDGKRKQPTRRNGRNARINRITRSPAALQNAKKRAMDMDANT
jgi:hypothetical protein